MLTGICKGNLVPRSGATDSKPNPLGDAPSAPSHRNRGTSREEIYWEPFRPNAIPPGRRDSDTILYKRGPRAVRPPRTGHAGPLSDPSLRSSDAPVAPPVAQAATARPGHGRELRLPSHGHRQLRRRTLKPLYEALAQHHYDVSAHAVSRFPTAPVDAQLAEYQDDLATDKTKVAVLECGGKAAVFCKIDIVRGRGYIDELFALPSWRSNGLGTRLHS